jgi:WD40 repeat protein
MSRKLSIIQRLVGVALVAGLAACGGGDDATVEPTDQPGIKGPNNQIVTPLPPAPAWVEPEGPITLDNVTRIAYLGRLDLPRETSTIFSYDFSPDSTRLAGLSNNEIVVWDLFTGQLAFEITRRDATHIFYSPDKTELYSVDYTGAAEVYDGDTGTLKADFLAHEAFNGVAAYYQDEGWLAVGGVDGSVKVWDTLERRSLVTIDAQLDEITWLDFSPDGQWLVTTGLDGGVKVWDWQSRTTVAEFENETMTPVRSAFSPDGRRLAIGNDTAISVWVVADQLFLFDLQTGRGGSSDVLMYSPDGQYLVNGGGIPDMMIWNAETGDFVALLPGVGADRTSATFSPDGDFLLASVLDGPTTLWDMRNIGDTTVVRANLEVGTRRVLDVDWTDDGYVMLFFDAVGPIYVWGVPTAAGQ